MNLNNPIVINMELTKIPLPGIKNSIAYPNTPISTRTAQVLESYYPAAVKSVSRLKKIHFGKFIEEIQNPDSVNNMAALLHRLTAASGELIQSLVIKTEKESGIITGAKASALRFDHYV